LSTSLLPAGAAPAGLLPDTAALFIGGQLLVLGDAGPNTIVISTTPDGTVLVNDGAVPLRLGRPTVASTTRILVASGGGNDTVTIDDANGALPGALLLGGSGNDALTGGSGADVLAGQSGDDTLASRAGDDKLLGGDGNDVLTGGSGTDAASGEAGDDRLVWNPGDGTDVNEGGDGVDTTEVIGGNVAEQFTARPEGTRVRFDRTSPGPFSIDMGTVERLVLLANGGNDSFAAGGSLSGLIATTVDGGAGNDTISGTDGADRLIGGAGNDSIDGQQGADVAELGSEDDVFTWDPGDGSDVVEGQAGVDTMVFNGGEGAEQIDVSANGGRARLFRTPGNVTMDTDDVERFVVNGRGGADAIVVNDLAGTDVTEVLTDLGGGNGLDDGAADTVRVLGTPGNDAVTLTGALPGTEVAGLAARVTVSGAGAVNDQLTVATLAGADAIDASGVPAGAVALVLDGGDGADVVVGGDGDDTLIGGDGDDTLIGGPGIDVFDDGTGGDIVIQSASTAGAS
jgi:Ca2+-binding RTX toxin-like protein